MTLRQKMIEFSSNPHVNSVALRGGAQSGEAGHRAAGGVGQSCGREFYMTHPNALAARLRIVTEITLGLWGGMLNSAHISL